MYSRKTIIAPSGMIINTVSFKNNVLMYHGFFFSNLVFVFDYFPTLDKVQEVPGLIEYVAFCVP